MDRLLLYSMTVTSSRATRPSGSAVFPFSYKSLAWRNLLLPFFPYSTTGGFLFITWLMECSTTSVRVLRILQSVEKTQVGRPRPQTTLCGPTRRTSAAKPCATLVLGYALHGFQPFLALVGLRPPLVAGFGLSSSSMLRTLKLVCGESAAAQGGLPLGSPVCLWQTELFK